MYYKSISKFLVVYFVYCLSLSICFGWSSTSMWFWKSQNVLIWKWCHSGVTVSVPSSSSQSSLSLRVLLSWPFLWPADMTQQSGGKRQQWQQSRHPRSEKKPLVDCNVVGLTFSEASPLSFDVIVDMWIPGCTNCCSSADWWLSDWTARSCREAEEPL